MRKRDKPFVLHLKRDFIHPDGSISHPYQEINSGEKRCEYRKGHDRNGKPYWLKMFLASQYEIGDVRIYFVEGFPKNNKPRLEADLTSVEYYETSDSLKLCFTNVIEVKK